MLIGISQESGLFTPHLLMKANLLQITQVKFLIILCYLSARNKDRVLYGTFENHGYYINGCLLNGHAP